MSVNKEEKEKEARRMVTELEQFLGCVVNNPPKGDKSYDLLIKHGTVEIHGEVKGSGPRGTWIGINGLGALHRLLEDPEYRVYFCVVDDNCAVLKCRAALVLKLLGVPLAEIKKLHEAVNYLENLKLSKDLGFAARIQFHLPRPIGELISAIEKASPDEYGFAIDGIWRFRTGAWVQTFPFVSAHASVGDD